ncbi:cytochrome P450 [Flagelloscypha sp. PMI_526]|nr:cytochrome P450 [Flagelloscypha sp. PMI_526]
MLAFHQQLAVAVLICVFAVTLIFKRWKRKNVNYVRGPERESWLLGNMGQYFRSEAGVADAKWTAEYGNVVRLHGAFGSSALLVNDPKALQTIYNSGYKYQKHPIRRQLTKVLLGGGLTIADGEEHRLQRRINTPAFGFPETRAHVPLFIEYASKVCDLWQARLGGDDSVTIDVNVAISGATLDVIGHAAFDYEFNALNDGVTQNQLRKAISLVATKSFGAPSDLTIIFQNILEFAPEWLVSFYVNHSSLFAFGRQTRDLGMSIAKELVQGKREELRLGKGKRDIFSLLVKANETTDSKSRLSDYDLHAQMLTIITAGHETTATALSWSLFELGRRPEIQKRLRDEVNAHYNRIRETGQEIFTWSDFEKMEYLSAFTKVILFYFEGGTLCNLTLRQEAFRFHPAVSWGWRTSVIDQVLPLSRPLTTVTGEVVDSLHIPKGTSILTSISSFNRNKDVFGSDADVFNPGRFLNQKINTFGAPVGVYGNVLTFGGGTRACIGWRFALLEYQSFLTEIIRRFEFEWVPETTKIRHENVIVTVPVVEGQIERGARMPLKIRPVMSPKE